MMSKPKISIIVATAQNNVIGKDNKLIWHLPADLKHFKELTTGHHIIMGRKTFESIGKSLPNRVSVIITRNPDYTFQGCLVAHSLQEAIELSMTDNEVFIIGGAEIYQQALAVADKVYLTKIYQDFEGDTFFPALPLQDWKETKHIEFEPDEKNKFQYAFCEFEKI